MTDRRSVPIRGRGTSDAVDGRYLDWKREAADDGWDIAEEPRAVQTQVTIEHPRSVISRNESPDIPFEISVNPYRGCENGCVYCYARPTHAWLDLSPGIDFETRLFAKPTAPDLLRREIARPGYRCSPLALGTNTDPYQPIERDHGITRGIIRVLAEANHPLTIVTKSALVERDIDLLAPMAEKNLAQVFLSVTSLDQRLARRLEPRAAAPQRRLLALLRLHEAGIPTGVMFAPVIPFLNDADLEAVLEAAAEAGVQSAGYVVIRLPHEIKELFADWLRQHEPLKAERVMNAIRDLRGGREYDSRFFKRQRGVGAFADLIKARFDNTCRRLALNRKRLELRTDLFRPPDMTRDAGGPNAQNRRQLDLF
jgi:DNA repair photolyase